jgi:hypothetical protein
VPEPAWIDETLEEAPGGVAEKPNGGDEQQRAAEGLCQNGRKGAAHPRHSSAEFARDLQGQHADDQVEHTFDEDARASEQLERAETVHGSFLPSFLRIVKRDLYWVEGVRSEGSADPVEKLRVPCVFGVADR